MVIVKRGSKYELFSKTSKRHLGEFASKKEAVAREKQIEYFKHKEEHQGWRK